MTLDDLKYAQRERLIFLDTQFVWTGRAQRKHLIDAFGISVAQAAVDFKEYLARSREGAVKYDSSAKAYFTDQNFKPIAPEASLTPAESLIGQKLATDNASLPPLKREADPIILAQLSCAMANKMAISVNYVSMSSGEDEVQKIAPTQFASDGQRIHFRAYSFKRSEYRDYVPSRVQNISFCKKVPKDASLPRDKDWHSTTLIYLKPKQTLSPVQKQVVMQEYDFLDGTLCLPIRTALEFYVDRRWGLKLESSRLERVETEHIDMDIEDYVRSQS